MSQRRSRFEVKLANKAERNLALCAVWIVGPEAGAYLDRTANAPSYPIIIGTGADPDLALRQARYWNWAEVDLLAVVWCGSEADAKAVKEEMEDIATEAGAVIRGRWWNMTVDVAEEAIRLAADGAGVEIFDAQTRTERLRQEIRRITEKVWNRT